MNVIELAPKDIRQQNIVFIVETGDGRITCNAPSRPEKSPNEVRISLEQYHALKAKGLV